MKFNLEELSYTNPNAYSIYHRGAQSRQAEIDALSALGEMSEQNIDDLVKRNIELQKELETLQGMHNSVSLMAGDLLDERDELKKRIDDAWMWCEKGCMLKAMSILKGQNHD